MRKACRCGSSPRRLKGTDAPPDINDLSLELVSFRTGRDAKLDYRPDADKGASGAKPRAFRARLASHRQPSPAFCSLDDRGRESSGRPAGRQELARCPASRWRRCCPGKAGRPLFAARSWPSIPEPTRSGSSWATSSPNGRRLSQLDPVRPTLKTDARPLHGAVARWHMKSATANRLLDFDAGQLTFRLALHQVFAEVLPTLSPSASSPGSSATPARTSAS